MNAPASPLTAASALGLTADELADIAAFADTLDDSDPLYWPALAAADGCEASLAELNAMLVVDGCEPFGLVPERQELAL